MIATIHQMQSADLLQRIVAHVVLAGAFTSRRAGRRAIGEYGLDIGGPVQGCIVYQDITTICGDLRIDMHHVDPTFDRVFKAC